MRLLPRTRRACTCLDVFKNPSAPASPSSIPSSGPATIFILFNYLVPTSPLSCLTDPSPSRSFSLQPACPSSPATRSHPPSGRLSGHIRPATSDTRSRFDVIRGVEHNSRRRLFRSLIRLIISVVCQSGPIRVAHLDPPPHPAASGSPDLTRRNAKIGDRLARPAAPADHPPPPACPVRFF